MKTVLISAKVPDDYPEDKIDVIGYEGNISAPFERKILNLPTEDEFKTIITETFKNMNFGSEALKELAIKDYLSSYSLIINKILNQ